LALTAKKKAARQHQPDAEFFAEIIAYISPIRDVEERRYYLYRTPQGVGP